MKSLTGWSPAHGEVIIFKPADPSKYFIKRIIGLPGEKYRLMERTFPSQQPTAKKFLSEPYIEAPLW